MTLISGQTKVPSQTSTGRQLQHTSKRKQHMNKLHFKTLKQPLAHIHTYSPFAAKKEADAFSEPGKNVLSASQGHIPYVYEVRNLHNITVAKGVCM